MKVNEDIESYEQFREVLESDTPVSGKESQYFELVQKTHEIIRDQIGGIRRIRAITVEAAQNPVETAKLKPLLNRLNEICPVINWHENTLQLSFPTIKQGNHAVQRTSKYYRKYIDQWLGSRDAHGKTQKQQESTLKEANEILSEIGQLWKKAEKQEVEVEVSMTTSAIGFLMLGHYGVDDNSCFKNSGGSAVSKMNLGISQDTYVILIRDHKSKMLARCWGFSTDPQTYNISNIYFDQSIQEATIIETLKLFFTELLGEQINVFEDMVCVDHAYIYQNPYGNLTFSTKEVVEFQSLFAYDLYGHGACVICLQQVKNPVWYRGSKACKNCVKGCKFDSYNNWFTNETMMDAHDKNGDEVKVEAASADFIKCSVCTGIYHKDTVYSFMNQYYCDSDYHEKLKSIEVGPKEESVKPKVVAKKKKSSDDEWVNWPSYDEDLAERM